jgi:hypothetical protein
VDQVIEVTEQTRDHDPDFAMNLLRRAAGKSWWIGRSEERRELFVAAVKRMGIPEDNPQRLAILAMVAPTRYESDVLEHLSRPPEEAADPIVASALASSKLVKNSRLKIYEGAPHGLADTHKDQLNADLLAFLRE